MSDINARIVLINKFVDDMSLELPVLKVGMGLYRSVLDAINENIYTPVHFTVISQLTNQDAMIEFELKKYALDNEFDEG